jgi:uncharacterized membrane protein
MSPQLLALLTALSYSSANISVRRGLEHSTPMTATLLSLTTHTLILWAAVFLTGGLPKVPPTALLAIALSGMIQAAVRGFHYTGIKRVGVSRAVTLRNTHPILSVMVGIVVLREDASVTGLMGALLVVTGTILTSWKPDNQLSSFRWWYFLFPLATASLTGMLHPIRRYAMTIADEPLFFAALVAPVALICFTVFVSLLNTKERLVWNQRAFMPFIGAGLFESLAGLFMFSAFATGPVVLVSPLTATSPIWTLLMTVAFLRDLERINSYTVIGTSCVVVGVMAIILGG